MVGIEELPVFLRSIEAHPFFIAHKEVLSFKGRSFASLFHSTCETLLETRSFSNLTLKTEDGMEEKVHLEVLIVRSKFIQLMLRGEWKERDHIQQERELMIEGLSGDDLSSFVSLLYSFKFPEEDEPSVGSLLRLLQHFLQYQEDQFAQIVKKKLIEVIKGTTTDNLSLLLLENGVLLTDLPEKEQKQILLAFGEDPKMNKLLLEFSCQTSVHVNQMMNIEKEGLIKENERLIKEKEESWKKERTSLIVERDEEIREKEQIIKEIEGLRKRLRSFEDEDKQTPKKRRIDK